MSPVWVETASPCSALLWAWPGTVIYMGCVYDWDSVPFYHEQNNCGLTAEAGIAREIEKYTTELDRDWIIRENIELAIKCYKRGGHWI